MVTTRYSDQVLGYTTTPTDQATASSEGDLIRRYFSFTVPAATVAAGDTLFLTYIRPGERMLGGVFKNTAGGAAATAKIQTYSSLLPASLVSDSHYGTLTDLTNITAQTFADTQAKNFGEVATGFWWIGILTASQAIQAAAVLVGYIEVLSAG